MKPTLHAPGPLTRTRTRRAARAARPLLVLALSAAVATTAACGQATPSGAITPADGGTSSGSSATTPAGSGSTTASGGQQAPVRLTATKGGITLTATLGAGFAKHPDDPGIRRMPGLVVDYTISNAGSGEVLAYDVVPASLGSAALPADLNPEHAWVHSEGGVVRVTKQSFATAPGVSFIAAPTTGARVVPAGGALTGRAYAVAPPRLDVPGPEFTAPRGALDGSATTWQFCVQVGPRTTPGRAVAGLEGVLGVPVAAPTPEQLVCTDPTALPAV